MNNEAFTRFAMLAGQENVSLLKSKSVIVFGVGGVGGYVCEALARSGIGRIDVVDNDRVSTSNINRQIIALTSTVGMNKTEVMKSRMLDINPELLCRTYNMFYLPETADDIDLSVYDFAVDAIDTVSGKIELIKRCKTLGVPIISSMGTGNKLDPTKVVLTDIYKTRTCPLARVMRGLCRKNSIDSLDVVYSEEEPTPPLFQPSSENDSTRRSTPSSSAFVPPAAGLTIAYGVIKKILNLC